MVDRLDASTPIVDKLGAPTKEFMIKWAQLANTLGTIPALSTAAEVSAVLDVLGGAEGDILYRGVSEWGVLPPGTAGKVLTMGAALPEWDTPSAPALASLTDVTLSSPANGDVLTYVTAASKWENKPASGGGGGGTPISYADYLFVMGLTSGANAFAMSELWIKDGSGTKQTPASATATDNYDPVNYPVTNLYDNNINTLWTSNTNTFGALGHIITYNFSSAFAAGSVEVTARNDGNYGQSLTYAELFGSNDSGVTWTPINALYFTAAGAAADVRSATILW